MNNLLTLHLSPNGDNKNDGTKNSPIKTITEAQKRVRELIAQQKSSLEKREIIIILQEGVYLIETTLKFSPKDGGCENLSVIYRAQKDAHVVISGGKQVTNWQHHKGNIWVADCPVEDTRQFYVDGIRIPRTQMPIEQLTNPKLIKQNDLGFSLKPKKLKIPIHKWGNIQDVEFVYQQWWTLSRLHIEKIEKNKLSSIIKSVKVVMQQPSFYFARTKGGRQIIKPTWIENAYELLENENEWYLDRPAKKIYYIPPNGKNPNDLNCVVPAVESIIRIVGDEIQPVQNLEFCGIKFEYATWLRPNQYCVGVPDLQANVFEIAGKYNRTREMTTGNIYCEYSKGIRFLRCEFTHFGGVGVDFRRGIHESKIEGCTFQDISAAAIQIGEIFHPEYEESNPGIVKSITIANNFITKCSVEYWGGCGIFAAYVQDILIEHNTICHLPYTGISVGWGWSEDATICKGNKVRYNHIFAIMKRLIDGGAIYTLSLQPGTEIIGNHIHDSGWDGLYPDERTSETKWIDNIAYRCKYCFQDHSMLPLENNVITENFFGSLPDRSDFYPKGIPEGNNWDFSPDTKEGNISKIISQAGIQDEFQDILPKNIEEWLYIPEKSK
jgi:glycosyl hydrolase family 141/parallel beta helix pectate lyase-like protein